MTLRMIVPNPRFIRALLSVLGVTILSQVLLWLGKVPEHFIPSPLRVLQEIYTERQVLLSYAGTTLVDVLAGLGIGGVAGFALGAIMSQWRKAAAYLYPHLLASQVIPKVALAPILLIWFGYGHAPKVIITALITFFPITANTILGMTHIDERFVDLMRSLHANSWQTLGKLKIPHCLPFVAAAARISALYAVVGAITAEFVASNSGIGYLIILAQSRLNMPLMFAGLVAASLLGGACWMLVDGLGRLLCHGPGLRGIARNRVAVEGV